MHSAAVQGHVYATRSMCIWPVITLHSDTAVQWAIRTMIERITISGVAPGDGIHYQPKILTAAERLQMIAAIAASDVKPIEMASLVSPEAGPVMAGN